MIPSTADLRATLSVAALIPLLLGCGSSDDDVVPAASEPGAAEVVADAGPGYTNVDALTLSGLLAEDDFLLVNVHIPYEGEIGGTDVHIPFNDIAGHLDALPEDRDAPIALYCRSGSMSTSAATELVARGYTNLVHLDGGMIAWEAAGLPLEGGDAPR